MYENIAREIIDYFGYNDVDHSEKNRIIGEVIDIIQSLEPKELDEPDGEGWYWFKSDRYQLEGTWYVKIIDGNIKIYDGLPCFDSEIAYNCFRGKWIKAIEPEVTK